MAYSDILLIRVCCVLSGGMYQTAAFYLFREILLLAQTELNVFNLLAAENVTNISMFHRQILLLTEVK